MTKIFGVAQTVHDLVAFPKKAKSSTRLDKDLSQAVRAEGPPRAGFWDSHEYGNIIRETYGKSIGDGMWLCECGSENELIHYKGDHPFKHLCCLSCDRNYCRKFPSSDIFRTYGHHQPPTSGEPRAGQMCSNCGLTHRARVNKGQLCFDTVCSCGKASDASWIHFSIGSVKDYRRDSVRCPLDLKRRRANALTD